MNNKETETDKHNRLTDLAKHVKINWKTFFQMAQEVKLVIKHKKIKPDVAQSTKHRIRLSRSALCF